MSAQDQRLESGEVGIIVAYNKDRVIGREGTIPWHYSADLKRFKQLTLGTTVIMGRKTWESLPKKPLPDRINFVVTRTSLPGVTCFPSVNQALTAATRPVWFIGGQRIYQEALPLTDVIDVTLVPDDVPLEGAVFFPPIDPGEFSAPEPFLHPDDSRLKRQIFRRLRART